MRKLLALPIKLIALTVTKLPLPLQMLLGDLFGLLWYDVLRIRRQIILDNLKIAFPGMTLEDRSTLGRLSCKNMGRCFIEYFRMPFLKVGDAKSMSYFELVGKENMDSALGKNKGVCMLTLHLGSPDFAIPGMGVHSYFLHVISKTFKYSWLNELWFGMRRKSGTEFIPPRNSSYAILKALKANKIVVFVQDQFMGPPIGVKTTFFGKETGTALGLAVMATRTKAPIVPVYTYRRSDGKVVIVIEPEMSFEELDDRDEMMLRLTQKCNDRLQEYVEKYPEQWMWVHRRWKKFKH